MGKYLKNFNTTEEYEAFREGDQYLVPNVSFIENTASVINDSWYVPQSGGSGGGGSTMEYLDVSGLDEANVARLIVYGNIVKFSYNGQSAFLTTANPYVGMLIKDVPPSAISIDFATVVTFTDIMQNMTIKDALLQTGSTPITEAELAAIPRITKEQFYTI